MSIDKNNRTKEKLHKRNRNRERYDLNALMIATPELKQYVKPNEYGDDSINFSNSSAVRILNKALLSHYYGIKSWEFPADNLCPPIPGRADYIHYVADLLSEHNSKIPKGDKITCLDIGVGAACIYPILGVTEYGWKFIATDIDPKTIDSARNIVDSNPTLRNKIEFRLQKNSKNIFYGIIAEGEKIDLTICNPPFHSSSEEAEKGARRKAKNLSGGKIKNPTLNFSGTNSELIYEGGEIKFIELMIKESRAFSKDCYWFSTLLSKESNLNKIEKLLENAKVNRSKMIPIATGNKSSRIIAWTYLSKAEQKDWREARWSTKQ